jgi:SPP1 gp7 family putative phage head morphogenesis protein
MLADSTCDKNNTNIREHFQRMPLEQLLPEIAFPLEEMARNIANDIQRINADMHTALLGQKSDIFQSHTIPEATEAFSSVYAHTIEGGAAAMLEAELAKLGTQGKNATQIMEHMELARAFYQDTTIPYKIDMLATHFNGKLSEIRQADSDISHYVWTTADDEKVRSAHAENDGKIFAWNVPPETGHPGEDYNCRCIAVPVRTRSPEEIEALLHDNAIEPVYPIEEIIIFAYSFSRIAFTQIRQATLRIFRNPVARRPRGVPKDWKKVPSKKKEGYKYVDPKNKHNDVRVQRGNRDVSNPSQQNDYVKWKKEGKWLDKNGKVVKGESPESHIPLDEFKFDKDMFK